jgi:nuclear protein localization family protein 4
MCEYCLPLPPYDQSYLDENKIKHMAFHAYLRKIIETNKIPNPYSPHFIAPLDIPDYKVLKPCPSGTHSPYPYGICKSLSLSLKPQVANVNHLPLLYKLNPLEW